MDEKSCFSEVRNLGTKSETHLLNKETHLLNRETHLLNKETHLLNMETHLLNKETCKEGFFVLPLNPCKKMNLLVLGAPGELEAHPW